MSEQTSETPGSNEGQDKSAQKFSLQKIYLKDTSFETPNSPEIFTEKWDPAINIELQTAGKPLSQEVQEVVLTVTVTAKLGDKTAYLVEVHQAGVFTVSGFEGDQLAHMLGSFCPSILFPYAREAVSDIVGKGGFPQILLSPVNFDALFAQHKQELQQKLAQTAEESIH